MTNASVWPRPQQGERLLDLAWCRREVRPDRDHDHGRPAMVAPQMAQHLQRVAHEAPLARVDLEALARHLMRGAEQHRVPDRDRRGIEALGDARGVQVDPDAARGHGEG